MKLSEHLENMDPELTSNLERALAAVREEFEQKIAATVEQTVAAAAEEAAHRETPVSETPAIAAPMSLDAADELRLAALDIDTATSQSEILEALSRGALRFASRVAVFVNRGEETHGWSATGFGEADNRIKQISLGGDVPFPIGKLVSDGSVALSSDDCSVVCNALGVENGSMGLLLPFVLGSQVVGTVYCDRIGEGTFSVSALQLLTYIAGQTLETLPVRKRDSTVTLSLTGGSVVSDTAVTTLEPPETDLPSEAVVETVPQPTPEPPIEAAAEEPVTADGGIEEVGVAEPDEVPMADMDLSTPDIEPAPDSPPAISEPSLDALPTAEDEGSLEDELPEPAQAPEQSTTDPVEPVAEPAQPVVGLSSTQVAPPSDLQGPGWAFTSTTEQSDAGSESEHEEAQRLARLLVTEIKLYNEEAVEGGRRDGDVYSRLQEDIDRSRQIFEDRIDPAVRNENDYFKQALVRILAGGDPSLLGI